MHKKRAFTLIELLVVIAIIALLMSILMPALAKVKKQAMSVVCRSRLKQMGVVFSMYTSENDGYFHTRPGVGTDEAYKRIWHIVYKRYYIDPKMRYCPTAENNERKTGPFATWVPELGSWKSENYPVPGEGDNQTGPRAPTGSYGMNYWIENMTVGIMGTSPGYWRKADVKGGDKAEILTDCVYVYFWGDNVSRPPAYNGDFTTPTMHWASVDRHMGCSNAVFLDFSARKVGLKELWTLKHGRQTNLCDPAGWSICTFDGDRGACHAAWHDAAAWMDKMPEY